ncbi:hypothetical protein NW755_012624 [Fusarium falciforme]|uniref:Uncharacterized protein n=1 Tax=Fusarium falciforme TaxID=195108 RepID=A0A9W8QUA6_9HYPO|nr:hypothetical protein NW755_012624 [Fusarium falciforme]
MDSDDIRKRLPTSDHNDDAAAVILETRPPFCSIRDKHSGLDCLITVLRRIYTDSFLGPNGLAQKEWFAAAESENPILTHAWHMFGQGEEDVRKATEARNSLLKSLQEMGMTGEESFSELDRSPLMAKTFWGQSELVLFHPKFDAMTLEVFSSTKQEKGEGSLIKAQRHVDGLTVQGRIDQIFGVHPNGGIHLILRPARPEILRVEYHPAEDPTDRPPFHSFRLIDLPDWIYRQGDGELSFDMTGRVPYALIAVVQHRDEPTGSDSVRTYSANGANIVPEYEPSSYTPGNWSLEDAKRHTYTLFYGRSDLDMLPLEPFPELDRRVADLEFWRCVVGSIQSRPSLQKTQLAGVTPRQEPKTVAPRQEHGAASSQREAPVTGHSPERKGAPEQQESHRGMEKDRYGTLIRREEHAPAGKSESRQLKRKHGDDGPDKPGTRAPKPRSDHPLPGTGQDRQPARPPIGMSANKQAGGHSRNGRPRPSGSQSPRRSGHREDDRQDRDRGAKERRKSGGLHARGEVRGDGSKDHRERDGRDRNE